MNGLQAIAGVIPAFRRTAWWRRAAGTRIASATRYLRGLTLGRIGLVLLICILFSVRQHVWCLFQISCGMPDGGTIGGFTRFVARQFLFAMPIVLAVTVADNVSARSSNWVRIAWLAAAVLLGAVVYALAFLYTQPANVLNSASGREPLFLIAYGSRAVLYGGLATGILYLFSRERSDARALHAASIEKLSLERQTIEARLQALQAQIEPHFLFNTLANVKLLYESDWRRAKPLLHDLAAYLRTALPRMREAQSTLGRELDLVEAYLRVLKVRMGERLEFVIAATDLRQCTLPPLMLLTLVENAVKHGLSPLPAGGTIAIRAERVDGRLRVSVHDDGMGFRRGHGTGVGLSNTRARLAALYGSGGRLTLDAVPGGGVVAGIEIPCEIAGAQPANA